jgi:hypothetical protein
VDFFLRAANSKIEGNNFVFLVKRTNLQTSDVYIPAYWLPWKGQGECADAGRQGAVHVHIRDDELPVLGPDQ